jgi:Arm DNA-binding domain
VPRKCQITDIVVRSLPEGEWWDSKLPAFGVRVGKRTRTFILKKDNSRIALGRYGDVTLQEARKRALTLKGASKNSSFFGPVRVCCLTA